MAIKVKLLQKTISKGRKSLYLDFWPAISNPSTGEMTRREFLKMYVYEKPRTAIEKLHNFGAVETRRGYPTEKRE